jgi:hypothetical protein
MHYKLVNWLKLAAGSINTYYNAKVCDGYRNYYLDTNFDLSKFRICNDDQSCRKVVVKYFGLVAAPQLMHYILWKYNNTAGNYAVATDYVIADEGGRVGFRGNVTDYVNLYGNRYLPNITVYKSSLDFLGLF